MWKGRRRSGAKRRPAAAFLVKVKTIAQTPLPLAFRKFLGLWVNPEGSVGNRSGSLPRQGVRCERANLPLSGRPIGDAVERVAGRFAVNHGLGLPVFDANRELHLAGSIPQIRGLRQFLCGVCAAMRIIRIFLNESGSKGRTRTVSAAKIRGFQRVSSTIRANLAVFFTTPTPISSGTPSGSWRRRDGGRGLAGVAGSFSLPLGGSPRPSFSSKSRFYPGQNRWFRIFLKIK
jgi:hypothetical protein